MADFLPPRKHMEQFFSIPAKLQPMNEWLQKGPIAPKSRPK
jgi:hypothetical protein